MSLSIIFTGLFADFLKIFLKRKSQDQESLRVNPIELLLPALSAAGFFLFSQNLANSFSIEVRKNQEVLLVIAVLLSCVYGAREVLRSTHNQQRYEFQMIRVEIRGVISSSSAFAAWIVFTAMVFSWSQAWLTTFLSSLIFLLTISLTIIRFSQPKISFLSKVPRNIIAEAMISSICAFGIFMLIGNLAFTASQKSTLYVTLALIPCFFHALFVNLYDVPEADSAEGI
jgi:hypothetical protein